MTSLQPTTLTRAALLEKAKKPRYETVEIEGLGIVGIRQRTRLQESHRTYMMFDDRGKLIPKQRDMQPIYRLIDQLMIDEKTPMFSESDADELASMAEGELDDLFAAVQRFNNEVAIEEPKKTEELNATSES